MDDNLFYVENIKLIIITDFTYSIVLQISLFPLYDQWQLSSRIIINVFLFSYTTDSLHYVVPLVFNQFMQIL